MADYLEKKRSEMLMAWLAQATPDEWHQVASNWNWDGGEDALRWIIEQPSCDKATALLIFWRGEPNYYWHEAGKGSLISGDTYDMLVRILEKWKAGAFNRAELSYDPTSDARAGMWDVKNSVNDPALTITEDMVQPVTGRQLERGDFDEGIPDHIVLATL